MKHTTLVPLDFLLSNGVHPLEGEVKKRLIIAMQEYGAALVNQQRHIMEKHLNIRNVPKPKI